MRVLLDEQLPRHGFSVFITGDRSLEYQQNLTQRTLGVVVLAAASNALEDLLPLVPETLTAIQNVRSGQVLRVPERPPAG